MIRAILLFGFCLLIVFPVNLMAQSGGDRSAEVHKYIEMFQSESVKTRIDAAKYVSRSGLTDPRLFNFINDKLLKEYQLDSLNRHHIDEMSWLCKALATSGSDGYESTLNQIIQTTGSMKLKKYARQSLSLLAEYAQRNKVMSDTTNSDPNLSAELNRYIKMLRSEKFTLKRDAAKSIYRGGFTEKALFDVLNDELLKWYKTVSQTNRHEVDTLSWMCKALGSSGMSEYKSTLTEIYENSSNLKLRKYVKQSLEML
ncbi:MAG: hypothetical protein L3J69_12055 [Desulfobacula sp.]|nr:hypothetical protein [Desulfobacula sp.]